MELMATLQQALNFKLYNRYSKDLWLIPLICPDFLKRCKVETIPNGVRLEYEFFSEEFFSRLTTTGITEDEYMGDRELLYEGLRFTYIQKLNDIDPSLGILAIGLPYPPKPLWDVLYSLASLIFTLKIGRDKPNLILPEIQFITPHESESMITGSKIVIEIREISREEAKEKVKQWCDKLLPHDKRQSIIKELVQEGYITEDYAPLIRLNLLLEVIRNKAVKNYQKEKPIYFLRCPYCGSDFSTQNKRAIFCSSECNASFYSYLRRYNLTDELNKLKQTLIEMGISPEEASRKAIHMMVMKYPQLSKARRQELGIGRKRSQEQNPTGNQNEN